MKQEFREATLEKTKSLFPNFRFITWQDYEGYQGCFKIESIETDDNNKIAIRIIYNSNSNKFSLELLEGNYCRFKSWWSSSLEDCRQQLNVRLNVYREIVSFFEDDGCNDVQNSRYSEIVELVEKFHLDMQEVSVNVNVNVYVKFMKENYGEFLISHVTEEQVKKGLIFAKNWIDISFFSSFPNVPDKFLLLYEIQEETEEGEEKTVLHVEETEKYLASSFDTNVIAFSLPR